MLSVQLVSYKRHLRIVVNNFYRKRATRPEERGKRRRRSNFLLNNRFPGDGIVWSIAVVQRHSIIISISRLLDLAFLMADFIDCTQHSVRLRIFRSTVIKSQLIYKLLKCSWIVIQAVTDHPPRNFLLTKHLLSLVYHFLVGEIV